MAQITRSRATPEKSILACNAELPKLRSQKRTLQINSNSLILRERNKSVPLTSCLGQKCRPVLKDVTNLCCKTSKGDCLNAVKVPKKKIMRVGNSSLNVSKVTTQSTLKSINYQPSYHQGVALIKVTQSESSMNNRKEIQ